MGLLNEGVGVVLGLYKGKLVVYERDGLGHKVKGAVLVCLRQGIVVAGELAAKGGGFSRHPVAVGKFVVAQIADAEQLVFLPGCIKSHESSS